MNGDSSLPSLKEVKDFLKQVRVVEDEIDDRILVDQPTEVHDYVHMHAYRLWRSLQILESHLDLRKPLKILELGSMPYFFTALLRCFFREVEITGVNVKADPSGSQLPQSSTPRRVSLQFGDGGSIENFNIFLTNIEHNDLPFEVSTFDLVLCMEVIEHLVYSPTHMLVESHRVLKDGGMLFLSTPNAVDLRKTFLHLLNRPPGFPYSGYGVYGRHNREFILRELQELVTACGYSIARAWLENIYARKKDPLQKRFLYGIHSAMTSLPIPYLRNKRQYCLPEISLSVSPSFSKRMKISNTIQSFLKTRYLRCNPVSYKWCP